MFNQICPNSEREASYNAIANNLEEVITKEIYADGCRDDAEDAIARLVAARAGRGDSITEDEKESLIDGLYKHLLDVLAENYDALPQSQYDAFDLFGSMAELPTMED